MCICVPKWWGPEILLPPQPWTYMYYIQLYLDSNPVLQTWKKKCNLSIKSFLQILENLFYSIGEYGAYYIDKGGLLPAGILLALPPEHNTMLGLCLAILRKAVHGGIWAALGGHLSSHLSKAIISSLLENTGSAQEVSWE